MHGEKKKCKFDKYRDYFHQLVGKRIAQLQWKSAETNNINFPFVIKSEKQAKS